METIERFTDRTDYDCGTEMLGIIDMETVEEPVSF